MDDDPVFSVDVLDDVLEEEAVPERPKTKYRCRNCGHISEEQWMAVYVTRARGCPGCGGLFDFARKSREEGVFRGSLARAMSQAGKVTRISTGVPELDKVLGGDLQSGWGLVPGSTVIVTGPPSMGKTTILLQASDHIASPKRRVVYASGEMSADDVGMFAVRQGCKNTDHITLLGNEGDVYKVLAEAEEARAKILVVDSAQTAYVDDVGGDEGSAEQVRATANLLTSFGKRTKCVTLLVSHVNKDNEIVGPKALEHLVDAVLYLNPFNPLEFDEEAVAGLSMEEIKTLRVLSHEKNRYGAPGVRAVLEMTSAGLKTPARSISRLVI